MNKLLLLIALTLSVASCNGHKESQVKKEIEKEMNTLTFNEKQASCMSAIACSEASGDQLSLYDAINAGLDAGLTVSQIKEALSQLYAYTGFPRSLNALGTLQKVLAERKKPFEAGQEATPLPKDYDALKQGTDIQTRLSGQPFNYEFCPAEDYYLKAHLFGDIFARDILSHADRELVTVSALSAMEVVEPQLKAHVKGARNMGLPTSSCYRYQSHWPLTVVRQPLPEF